MCSGHYQAYIDLSLELRFNIQGTLITHQATRAAILKPSCPKLGISQIETKHLHSCRFSSDVYIHVSHNGYSISYKLHLQWPASTYAPKLAKRLPNTSIRPYTLSSSIFPKLIQKNSAPRFMLLIDPTSPNVPYMTLLELRHIRLFDTNCLLQNYST